MIFKSQIIALMFVYVIGSGGAAIVKPDSIITPPLIELAAKEPQYKFTEDDIYLLAQLICGDKSKDGDGEYDFVGHVTKEQPYFTEMSKVLCVIMNRQRSDDPYFPDTVRQIVLQSGQFTPMPQNLKTKPSKIAIEKIRDWCGRYAKYDSSVQTIPKSHLYFKAGPNNTNVTRRNYK